LLGIGAYNPDSFYNANQAIFAWYLIPINTEFIYEASIDLE